MALHLPQEAAHRPSRSPSLSSNQIEQRLRRSRKPYGFNRTECQRASSWCGLVCRYGRLPCRRIHQWRKLANGPNSWDRESAWLDERRHRWSSGRPADTITAETVYLWRRNQGYHLLQVSTSRESLKSDPRRNLQTTGEDGDQIRALLLKRPRYVPRVRQVRWSNQLHRVARWEWSHIESNEPRLVAHLPASLLSIKWDNLLVEALYRSLLRQSPT